MQKWSRIRLELGRTSAFPAGSVSRGYLVQLPLDSAGRIDKAAMVLKPHRATVRRYWSTEPDESGTVAPAEDGWVMHCGNGPDRRLLVDGQPIQIGEQVLVLEPDGTTLPFHVASIR